VSQKKGLTFYDFCNENKFFININLISLLLFIISGYFSAISFFKPSLPLFAWIGMFFFPFAFYSAKNIYFKLLGFTIFLLVYQFFGHTWYMLSVYLAGGEIFNPFELVVYSIFVIGILAWVIPPQIPFLSGILLIQKFLPKILKKNNLNQVITPLFIWFPFSFLLGEYFIFSFSGLSMGSWLYSQWKFITVLKSVANLGWNLTLIICLIIPLSLSESIIFKEIKYFYVSLLGIFILMIQPNLNDEIPKILYESGSVYANNETFHPQKVDNKIKLLVWPEVARSGRPKVKEGKVQDVKIRPPFKSKDVFHIIGQETRIKEGLQNSVLALSPSGDIISVRAKKDLFPALETPFYRFMFKGRLEYISGNKLSYLEFNNKKIISLLCFEQMDRYLVKELNVNNDIDLITILARDSILGNNPEIYDQFTAMAVLLAVENKTPVIRSSINGPSAIISSDGRVLAISPPNQSGIISIKSLK
jgi:hypothetical protein